VKIEGMSDGLEVSVVHSEYNASSSYPGLPLLKSPASPVSMHFQGNGILESYFAPVSDFVPGDRSCIGKPIISLGAEMVTPGLRSFCPWSERAWRHDDVYDELWVPENTTLKSWVEPMRRKASMLVKEYYKFHPT
jgi:hypothetical protein